MVTTPDLQHNQRQSHTEKLARSHIFYLFLPFLKPYKWPFLLGIFFVGVAAVTSLLMGKAVQHLVDHGFGSGSEIKLFEAFAFVFLTIVVLAAASYGRVYILSWVGKRVVADMLHALFRKLVYADIRFFESNTPGEILSRMTNDTYILEDLISKSLPLFLRNLLIMAGAIMLMFTTSTYLSLIIIIVAPIVIIPLLILGKRVKKLAHNTQCAIATMSSRLEDVFSGIYMVQAFNREPFTAEKYGETVEQTFESDLFRLKAKATMTAFVMVWVFTAVLAVIWIGTTEVFTGVLTAGALSAFMFYAVTGAGAAAMLSEIFGDVLKATGASARIAEFTTLPTFDDTVVSRKPSFTSTIELSNVSFAYPTQTGISALHNMSFTINKGEKVALIGASGSGKTTIFHLLLRFYDPKSGKILIDGKTLGSWSPLDVRALFGIVPQDPVLFNASIRENVAFARPEATDGEIIEALKGAYAMDFVQHLPGGIDTVIGPKGMRLSGGQKQRLAIARAILRDPEILLLDEATSALDAESEMYVNQALATLMEGRTTIIIAHNLHTIRNVDNIIVIDDGKVIASGTHDTLMATNEGYRHLVALQFLD